MSGGQQALGGLIHVKHGYAFKSEFFRENGKYVVLTPGHFFEEGGFRSRPDKDRFYDGDIPGAFILPEGALIVAMTEQGPGLLGSSALVPEGDKFLHNQRIGLVIINEPSALDKNFLYRLFNTRQVRAQINGSASGTKVRHTAPERIYRVLVSIPPIDEQRRIASILASYDCLIENNRRRIALLEEAARFLYREWFVHFRFPGHEHVKITDSVPEGWERLKFEGACETVGGGTPSTQVTEYWDGDITWVVPTDVTRNGSLALLRSARQITDKGLRESSAQMLPADSILMTSRASVGFFALADTPVCTNQGFINIIPTLPASRFYVLHNLMSRVEEIRGHAAGSTYPEISKSRFRSLPVVIPPVMLREEFENIAASSHRLVRNLEIATAKLKEGRDLLLPRLISGELEV